MKALIKYVVLLLVLQFNFTNLYANTDSEAGETGLKVHHAKHHKSGVSYVNGGIGADEQQSIKTMRKDFSLQLTLAMKGGEYVSDVAISIENKAGEKVLGAENMGPLVLVKLAPGTYKVTATYEGKSHTKSVTVGRGVRDLYFYW